MKNNIDYEYFDSQVDKFLRNHMTAEEETAFKAELDTYEEKKQRARTIALMIHSMQEVGRDGRERDQRMIDTIKTMSEEQFRNVALKPHAVSLWSRITRYASAACVAGLLAIGGYRYYNYNQTVSLGEKEYMAYSLDISEMGTFKSASDNDTNIRVKLTELFANVKERKTIPSTISELERLYKLALDEDSSYYYYVDDIAWNLAIAYLKDGDREKPIPLLEDMIKRNERYPAITKPAKELIQKIKDL